MNLTDVYLFLQEHSDQFDLVNLAEESCKKLLGKEVHNEQSEWSIYKFKDLVFRLIEQELVFNHNLRQTPHIRTRIGIYIEDHNEIYFMNLEPLGYYQFDTIEDGEVINDWLVFEK